MILTRSVSNLFFIGVPRSTSNSTLKVLKSLKDLIVLKKEPGMIKVKDSRKISRVRIHESNLSEANKHRHNIREILKYSNATPIRRYTDIGYNCCFCYEAFADPGDLKNHTLEAHDDNTKQKFMCNKSLYCFVVKLDITLLQCSICSEEMESLDAFCTHLMEHNVRFYTDIKSRILPIKFDGDFLKCGICNSIYSNLKVLQEHMYSHFRNFVCQVCGAGFVNQQMISSHSEGHKIGVFSCDHCSKVYDTLRKKKIHERSVHINFLYKCGYCNEKFKDYHKKQAHLTAEHGVGLKTIVCQACGKSFSKQSLLTRHIKKDHLMERCHPCPECDKQFYSSYALKQHMIKHSGLREFQCEVCLKTYIRKRSLREHIRIHTDDRRFKCEHCGQAFVQKCSWQGHMRSKHSDIV